MGDPERPLVVAEHLTVVAGGRMLLNDASFTIARGEVVLLCAPSGTGKTVLLKIIAGLITSRTPNFEIRGRLFVDGVDLVTAEPGEAEGRVGIVFQNYALLEGWTIRANLAFAQEHRVPPLTGEAADAEAEALVKEMGLDASLPVGGLSGGQKQRAAFARTLAYAPSVIAYDEPTSGLDPANKDRVAQRIRKTNRDHGTTSIVVTHDVTGLLPVVDRVLMIEPASHRVSEVAKENAVERLHGLDVPALPGAVVESAAARLRSRTRAFLDGTVGAIAAFFKALLHLVPRWRSARWGLRFFGGYLRLVAGPAALAYFALSGFVIGFVTTYFTFRFLPYRDYTEALILDDLIGALGFGLYRILVPLIITILLAARAGAAIAADIGGRVAGHQMEAMQSLGAKPERYLLTGVVWAMLLGTPLIAFASFCASRIASAVVFAFMMPDRPLHFWGEMFHKLLFDGTGWVAARYLISAFLVGAVAYFRGIRPKRSPDDVAKEITLTIILTSLLVLTVQVVLSFFEFATL